MAFAIGVDHPKHEVNIGTLWRSAFCLGAAMLFTIGRRYERQHGDTVKAWRHVPLLHFRDVEDYRAHVPFGWPTVGVEIGRAATDLREFHHPREVVYLLGAEDHGLTNEAAALCKELIVIPSRFCLNVAVAGSIVMYDRAAKKHAPASEAPGEAP